MRRLSLGARTELYLSLCHRFAQPSMTQGRNHSDLAMLVGHFTQFPEEALPGVDFLFETSASRAGNGCQQKG